MKLKNFITAFLILVLVLQILPIRQAVRYFLVDNQTLEEVLHIDKGATKNFRLLDEDHKYLPEMAGFSRYFIYINNIPQLHFAETLPLFHASDVHTPPPNKV